MVPVRVDLATAQEIARRECGWTADEGDLVEIQAGFGNHNWRVPTPTGDVLLKIGPAASPGKWAAAQLGADRAREKGLAVPKVQSTTVIDDYVIRTLDWVEGESAGTLADDRRGQAQLGAELGAAIAALHADDLDHFGSRLDGSSGTFPTWASYVGDRLEVVERRAAAAGAPELALRQRAATVVKSLAQSVNGDCRPVVCHRDLHPDNLIVAPDGSLNGIIDWDMAEAWDAAGEWFKLDLFLFDRLPHARGPFESAYVAGAGIVSVDRRRLVVLLESLNLVANAGVFSADFVAFGLRQLEQLS